MKAAKTKEGTWRCRAYIGEVNGVKKFKSFTAETKKEAERRATVFLAAYHGQEIPSGKLADLCAQYIETRAAVLSPSTVRAYNGIHKKRFKNAPIGAVDISKLNSATAQAWVSQMVADGASPKTVKNAYGLLTAILAVYAPDMVLRVKLPERPRKTPYTPNNDDVRALLQLFEARGDFDMLRAVYLASCCSLRRGEIAALTAADIDRDRGTLTVSKSMVYIKGGNEIKTPKTATSYRTVPVPEKVMALLPRRGHIVNLTPAAITDRFMRAVKAAGVPHYRFHDLRHYWASVMAYNVTIPKTLAQELGGWAAGSATMERVYVGVLEDEKNAQLKKVAGAFEAIL